MEMNAERFENWGAYHQVYDTCYIGPGVDTRVDGWYQTFTAMAAAPEVPFLNIRNSSQAGKVATNIDTAEKLPWYFDLNSIGLRWIFPNPAVNAGDEHTGLATMSKWFETELPEHCYFELDIRSYTFLRLKGSHMPPGFGPQGYFDWGGAPNAVFTSLVQNGDGTMTNRWKFWKNLRIPDNTPIKARLVFDDHAKAMLQAFANVPGIDFGGQELFDNIAKIELTLRGIRYEQAIGEFRK